jgi:hypothetical protein
MSIAKCLIGAAIALGLATAGIATPASADPNAFGSLGCSCTPPAAAPGAKAPASDQVDQGIRNGLGYLHGSPPQHARN